MSQQLVKKGANGKHENVMPRSWIEAIKDKNTGQTLVEILQGFNMYFLPYNGNTSATRCLVPTMLRKKGLWITYVKYDGNVYTEWYAADELDDKSWGDSSNWRIGNNTLVGDITISANGNWVINGAETEFKAVGEKGNTPLLRVANNRLQVSYDLGDTYRDVTNNPVYTKFRWLATTGDTQANNVGRIQASTDEGKTWTNMSNDFTNNLHIKKYIGVNESLPTSGIAEGTIYAKGPYYAEDDTLNDNPIYRLWVYAWKGNTLAWQDNGEFQSIAAGVVQETGDSETKVMSQKAVTEKLSELGSEVRNINSKIIFPIENSYIDTSGAVVGNKFVPGGCSKYDGCASVYKLEVHEGEKYYMKGIGEPNYFCLYAIVDSDNIVTRLYKLKELDDYITINKGESFLYMNFYEYDKNNHGLWSIEKISIPEIDKEIKEINNSVSSIENTLNDLIGKTIPLVENSYYDTSGIAVGNYYNTGGYSQYDGCYCSTFIVGKGDKVIINGKGDPNYFRKYVVVDKNNLVTRYGGKDEGVTELDITDEEYQVYINLWEYNQSEDYVRIVKHYDLSKIESSVDRLESSVDILESSVGKLEQGIKNISILCLGDSITEFTDNTTKKGYVEYLQEISGANVIRGGIGGTQWAIRDTPSLTPSTTRQAYAALDLPSIIDAWISKDWGYVDASVLYLKERSDDNSRIIQNLKNNPIESVDVVTIMMGTNDYLNSTAVGDESSNNVNTMLGAINHVINTILAAKPSIKLYIFTNKCCYNGDINDDNWCMIKENDNGLTLAGVNDKIENLAKKNLIPCFDMLYTLGWNKSNFSEYFYSVDGVHPQKGEGFKVIAKKMWSYLQANRTF